MTVPPANPPRPGGIIASWSGTAYSTSQVWLISQLTSISEGLSPIRHPGTRLVGDGRPTTELEVAYSRSVRSSLGWGLNFGAILFYSILCPSTAGSSPPPESSIFLCPLLSLSIPLPVAPQCHLSYDVLTLRLILHPLSATLCF